MKTIKRVLLGTLSILGVSILIWTVILLNPNLSYAHATEFENITVYHNQDLESGTAEVIYNALEKIRSSELYHDDIKIDLCLNDDDFYKNIHPLTGLSLAYAMFDKAIVKNGDVDFSKNQIVTQWVVNNNEIRKFNLTHLLAHEFTHNLQFDRNTMYALNSTPSNPNWKLEGHAEYIANGFKNDGKLKVKLTAYLIEETKEHTGLPVFENEDGTKQIFSYYKYALVVQYLMEEKKLNYTEVCKLETSLEELYAEVVEWSKR